MIMAGAQFARGVSWYRIVSTKVYRIICYILHLEEETQLYRQSEPCDLKEGAHILNCQFSKCRVRISRKRSFRHCQLLMLQLDNLAISVTSTIEGKERESARIWEMRGRSG